MRPLAWIAILIYGAWLIGTWNLPLLPGCQIIAQPENQQQTHDDRTEEHCRTLGGTLKPVIISFLDVLHSSERTVFDGLLVAATIALATFTRTLSRSTHLLWVVTSRAAKATEIAADAAKASADALPDIERAYLFVTIQASNVHTSMSSARNVQMNPALADWLMAQCNIVNGGKTPAIILAYGAQMELRRDAPDEIPFEFIEPLPFNRLIRPDGEKNPRVVLRNTPVINAARADEYWGGMFSVWCYGRVIYADVFGEEHATEFCWRHSRDSDRFIETPARLNRRS